MVGHQKTSTYYYTRNRMEIGTTYRLRTPKTGLGEGGGRTQLQLKYLYIQNLYKISIEKYDWSDVIWKQAI